MDECMDIMYICRLEHLVKHMVQIFIVSGTEVSFYYAVFINHSYFAF